MTKKSKWSGKSKGSALGNLIFIKLIASFGTLPAYALLMMVALKYALMDKEFQKSVAQFRAHLGLSTSRYHYYIHAVSFGMSLIDSIAFLVGRARGFTLSQSGRHHLDEALCRRKGAIFLSGHLGNWEIAGNMLRDSADTAVNFIMLDAEKENVKRVLSKATGRRKVNVIPVSDNPIEMILPIKKALRRNEIVCMHGDRCVGYEEKAAVSFLGEEAQFPVGPFAVAALTGAPVIPAFTLKTGLHSYSLYVYEPIFVSGEPERGVTQERAMKRYVSILEDIARRHPCQWYNYFSFWGD
ncbi:MAG: hypothetical protein ACOC4C_01090 [Fibrobacterota bacterium]